MKVRISHLFWRELTFRSGAFLLGLVGVAAMAACLTGARAFLKAHDAETEKLTGALEERSTERMTELRDAARKFSKNLGFNCMLLPPKQRLGDLYATGRSTQFFAEADVAAMVDAQSATLNHMRPILRERVSWPEQQRDIILVGVRGEVYIKAPRWQKPIEEAIDHDKAHLGFALARELELKPGGSLKLMGRTFTVEHILPQAGGEDDIAVRVSLETAQELLDKRNKISAVLALMCNCANGDPDIVRREMNKYIPGIQVVDFTVRARARQTARSAIAEGTAAEVNDIKESRAALRTQIAGFSRVLVGLVTVGTVLLLSVLTLNNARERRGEVAMLRALGVRACGILGLFLMKALLVGAVGGIIGCVVGAFGTRLIAGEGARISLVYGGGVFAVTVGIALVATLVPAARSAAEDPAGILNQE
ncbi:MAG: hypothetical protein QGH42_11205 [Kiritimatiellia bacterium]|nr:hypothetical protein [Kiritimatiellia bacterium]MDP6631064.1 hypothetical protein [Kiritimatiellia bacterium]MDP6810020.1 hypothetical protein [Kiritimatiellia bacterium]MDP7024791.1 hypothetical protein [Kiritimatiellia bacterium]